MYQMMDEKGKGVGIPIKASSIYFKPGLRWLEEKFRTSQGITPAELHRIRQAIDASVRQTQGSWSGFTALLRAEQIAAIPYINAQQILYGLSFVDLRAHLVV